MTVAFCTTAKGRLPHVEKTLPANLADNPDAKFILLDYNSPDNLLDHLKANHQKDIDSGQLVVYSFTAPGPFRMAHAKNLAHRLAILEGADVLCNLDADNFTGTGFADYITEQFQTEDVFLWAKMIQYGPDKLTRGITGRIVVSAQAFINAGGYSEKYNIWSPDDKDFNLRLKRIGYVPQEVDKKYLKGIHHSDKMRFREYPHAEAATYELEQAILQEQADIMNMNNITVVNMGRFGMGTVYKNFDFTKPIVLGPVPTRIFGIGMHKTGTSSLHAALTALGFDSAHWKSGAWAKAIWQEMKQYGRSRTLEKHYAVSDLPITNLYRQLDQSYPGSKFILTTRNEDKWLDSVEKHWSYEHNKYRAEWDIYPASNMLHTDLYGRRTFDSEVFLARFRKHNSDVKDYFKSRPNDLLVMDLDDGAGWWDLCCFLDKPCPLTPYPRIFVTK